MSECTHMHMELIGDNLVGLGSPTTNEEFGRRIKRIKRRVRAENKTRTHKLVMLKIRGVEKLFDFPEGIDDAYLLAIEGDWMLKAWLEIAEMWPEDFGYEQVV
jgi:hypothetical protein